MIGELDVKRLPARERLALRRAIAYAIDAYLDDTADLLAGQEFAQTEMFAHLPAKYLYRYDVTFARRYLACLRTVAANLLSPDQHELTCVADELAMNALIEEAAFDLETDGEPADDFADRIHDLAYEDLDYEILFQPALDGVEEDELGMHHGLAHLSFKEWFLPFEGCGPLHPYLEDRP